MLLAFPQGSELSPRRGNTCPGSSLKNDALVSGKTPGAGFRGVSVHVPTADTLSLCLSMRWYEQVEVSAVKNPPPWVTDKEWALINPTLETIDLVGIGLCGRSNSPAQNMPVGADCAGWRMC